MPENLIYLIDENLPYKFKLWHSMEYVHVKDLSIIHTDEEIWEYAKSKSLTIVIKDADFSNKILFSTPPPRIIHLKMGNIRLADFHTFINTNWQDISKLSATHKLVQVYKDRIEAIE